MEENEKKLNYGYGKKRETMAYKAPLKVVHWK